MMDGISRRDLLGGGIAGLVAAAGSTGKRKTNANPRREADEPVAAAPPPPEAPYAFLDAIVPELLVKSHVPGVSIAIIKNNKIVYEKAFGVSNVATGKAMTTDNVFQAASLTKPVFGYSVLKLCERGQLGLDTPLVSYIPAARITRDPAVTRITPRQILAHISGLPDWTSGKRPLTLAYQPGLHFSYSSEAYNCLQEVVEKITGQTLSDYMMETIALPAGLSSSTFVWQDAYEDKIAMSYEWDGTLVLPRHKPTKATASSTMHTTARDYAKFLIWSLGREEQKPDQLEYVGKRMMVSPQVRLSESLAWGLGWGLRLEDDGDWHFHMGDARGYMSYGTLSRATGDGLVLFTNSRHGLRLNHAIAREILANQDPLFNWVYDFFYEGKLPQWPVA